LENDIVDVFKFNLEFLNKMRRRQCTHTTLFTFWKGSTINYTQKMKVKT